MDRGYKTLFYFTRKERRAMYWILSCIVCIHFSNDWFGAASGQGETNFAAFDKEVKAYYQTLEEPLISNQLDEVPDFDINVVVEDSLVKYGLPATTAKTWVKFRSAIGGFKEKDQVKEIYGIDEMWLVRNYDKMTISSPQSNKEDSDRKSSPDSEHKFFHFDPNKLSLDSLEILGFSSTAIRSMDKFRSKNRRIDEVEDIKYFFGVTRSFFEEIRPFVVIDTAVQGTDAKSKAYLTTITPKEPISIDINADNEYQWQSLPGIGPVIAGRIIRFRNRLGGFASIDQLAETYGLPDSTFQEIKPHLVMSPVFNSISINQISADSLKNHPYVNWKQANIIVNYRDQHGAYQLPEDLYKIRVFDTAFVQKLSPYLDFGL